MTANSTQAERERCLDAGMDDFLSKPLNEETLTAVLTRLISPAGEATELPERFDEE
jgi:CheY-like chemotaxis protein